jgi:hypothetical protein
MILTNYIKNWTSNIYQKVLLTYFILYRYKKSINGVYHLDQIFTRNHLKVENQIVFTALKVMIGLPNKAHIWKLLIMFYKINTFRALLYRI